MARIVVGAYMVRYPLGGMMSWALQYLLGFQRLGHDVYIVEKATYADACLDPMRKVMSDDGSYGIATVSALLGRFGLGEKWCFVDYAGRYHGLPRERVQQIFDSADVFVDIGTPGDWLDEAANLGLRMLIDGEPGFTQMKWEMRLAAGEQLPQYDVYCTSGLNVGTPCSTAPTAGLAWRHVPNPVSADVYVPQPPQPGGPFTTVMNWQSHESITYEGVTYGQKDVEFSKFVQLPSLTPAMLEIAVAGKDVPRQDLSEAGWRIRHAHEVTTSFDSFVAYIHASMGEFSVCKNVFVATKSGWFSDRSAAYLASARPVVLQDTGFSKHIPCGRGLFAVQSVEEAAAAVEEISGDFDRHSRAAREVALEYLDAPKVLGKVMRDVGL